MSANIHWVAAGVTALYGLVSLAGGIMGYIRANSMASLIAGGVAGILLIGCAAGVGRWPVVSLVAALVLALLLVGRFTVSLLTKSGEMTSLLYTTSVVMIAGGVVVIVCTLIALMTARPPTTP